MWPSGEAEVCKTFYDGSNPSITTVAGKQSLSTGDVSTSPFFIISHKAHRECKEHEVFLFKSDVK